MSERSPQTHVSSRPRHTTRIDGFTRPLTQEMKRQIRVPYGLRHVDAGLFETLLPPAAAPKAGEIALAQVEKIGKNTRLELTSGRPCALHVGDLIAVVFGNRYA